MCPRDDVTGKVEHCTGFDRRDIDWRVEQKLARVLAERDLYWRGVTDGFWIVAVFFGLVIMFWPEIKQVAKGK